MNINQILGRLLDLGPISEANERKIRANAFAFGVPPYTATNDELRKWKRDLLDYSTFR